MAGTQESLPIPLPGDFVPTELKRYGLKSGHTRPLVSVGKVEGVYQPAHRTHPRTAWRWPELQWCEAAEFVLGLALDVDDPDAFAVARAKHLDGGKGLPEPSVSVVRRENHHAHAVYVLRSPVYTGKGASWRPQGELRRYASWATHLGANDATPSLAHNPMRTQAAPLENWQTVWGRHQSYTLRELTACIDTGWRIKPLPTRITSLTAVAVGERYISLLRALGSWYGKPSNWWADEDDLRAHAVGLNNLMPLPLPLIEVTSLVRSLFRRQRRRLESGEQQETFSRIQAARGRCKRGYRKADKAAVAALAAAGHTAKHIAQELGIHVNTAKSMAHEHRLKRIDVEAKHCQALHEAGHSIRHIAALTGLTRQTIDRRLAR